MLFLLKEKPDKEGFVRLCGDDYHYLVNVRRLRPGAVFPALLTPPETETQRVQVTVIGIENRTLTGSVVYSGNGDPDTELPPIVLFQALPKGTKMDLIIRQAAETGISEIVPFVSEHSVQKESSRDNRIERWRRIVKEARQQSLSVTDTQVHGILSAGELFAYWKKLQNDYSKETVGLLFNPCTGKSEGMMISKSPLEQGGFHRYLNNKPPLLVLAVGPEGGFSIVEVNRFITDGFKSISLSDTVLRTETAALYGAAAAKIILMERALWKTTLQ